jgi:hypothetical protein
MKASLIAAAAIACAIPQPTFAADSQLLYRDASKPPSERAAFPSGAESPRGPVYRTSNIGYATGAFLLAGSKMLKSLPKPQLAKQPPLLS